jgi:uncharacterized protein with PQ loop repeat
MPIEPIKIPQNVYIEDRIVGPLTLKQIIVVAVGCGFSYALYSLLVQSYGKIPIPITVMAWIPGALSFVFAFIKINDLSLFRIILLMVERINKPETRVWTPRRGIVINIRTFTTPDEKQRNKTDTTLEGKNPDQISELSSILDLSMQSLVPAAAGGERDAISPLEESVERDDEPIGTPRPVNPTLVSVSAPMGQSTDTVIPPKSGSVSIFHDISPR